MKRYNLTGSGNGRIIEAKNHRGAKIAASKCINSDWFSQDLYVCLECVDTREKWTKDRNTNYYGDVIYSNWQQIV